MQAWPETRDTLLARLRDPADMQAWSEFTRLYEPVIKGFVTGRGLQTADAQDMCCGRWPGRRMTGRGTRSRDGFANGWPRLPATPR